MNEVSLFRLYGLRAMYLFIVVVLVYLAIPWRYVFVHYVRAHGDRWR